MVTLTEADFQKLNGDDVKKFTWTTGSGFSVSVISYGAIIQAIKVPDKNGEERDVVLGFDNLQDYVEKNSPYFGATVGRCANRIGGAKFQIDGNTYELAKNAGKNHLHGGNIGFHKVNWKSTVVGQKVIFSYLSKDGEENYPGDVVTNVIYEVKEDDSINIEFIATTTKKTVVNLTNHSYFNLAGHDAGSNELYNHVVTINADRITGTDADLKPTGRFIKVGGTPYDLRSATRVDHSINDIPQLFDDNFCVSNYGNKDLNFVSRVVHPSSGRYLEVYSDQPGVQFYTSGGLPRPSDSAIVGKGGNGYRYHGAFCLETQNFPDAVNHKNFPTPILVPGEVYKHRVVYRFGVEKANEPTVTGA